MTKQSFDLHNRAHAADFLREMFNLSVKLRELVNELDEAKRGILESIQNVSSKMMSLTSVKRSQRPPAPGGLNTLYEEGADAGAGQGRTRNFEANFSAHQVQSVLEQMNYQIIAVGAHVS